MILVEPAVPLKRAAQYLRMSTEHQKYSLDAQAAAISRYAIERGYVVTRTYADAGKSGVTLKGRDGLKRLLSDVVSGDADFATVLVLDVSRWGRFQDPDQAAHYEFLCRQAGVRVAYCGEEFENDGAMTSSVIKHLKRVMAAEYSRELSVKIRAAKFQQAALGFCTGAAVQFGLRKVLVDDSGERRGVLEPGEIKRLRNSKLVLAHGPAVEIELVQEIFRLFIQERRSPLQISRLLIEQGRTWTDGGVWTTKRVSRVLREQIYTGLKIFGRTFDYLGGGRVKVDPSLWLRVRVFDAIVSARDFERAAQLLQSSHHIPLSREDVRRRLGRLLREKGALNRKVIKACPYLPTLATIKNRMGNFDLACKSVGFDRAQASGSLKPTGEAYTDEEVLVGLKRIYAECGYISRALIEAADFLPRASSVSARFQSLENAYLAAGCSENPTEMRAAGNFHKKYGRSRGCGAPPLEAWRKPKRMTNADGSLLTDEQLLGCLQDLFVQFGYVTVQVIAGTPGAPPLGSFQRRFGSLRRAYELAGIFTSHSRACAEAYARRGLSRVEGREAAASASEQATPHRP